MLHQLRPCQRVIAWRLLEGRTVTHDELITALYGNDEDGGPDAPKEVCDVYVHHLRRAFAAYGIAIHTVWGRGWYVAAAHLPKMRDLLADELARNHRFPAPPQPPTVGAIQNEAWREVERRYG